MDKVIAGIVDDVLQVLDRHMPRPGFVCGNCSGIAQEGEEMFVVVEGRNLVTGHDKAVHRLHIRGRNGLDIEMLLNISTKMTSYIYWEPCLVHRRWQGSVKVHLFGMKFLSGGDPIMRSETSYPRANGLSWIDG